MPHHLTHSHFGDYTPLSRTPSTFSGPIQSGLEPSRFGLDELDDRPHFGVEELKSRQSGSEIPVSGGSRNFLHD